MASAPNDHFSTIAAAYARGRFGYPAALFDCLATLAPGRERAWDCATGSGQCVPELARRFADVVATDISAELLRHAPSFPNVTYAEAPAEHSGIGDHSVDLVTVAQAIHWFDLNAFWSEVRRVIRPGGILAFWAYTWPQVGNEIDAIFSHLRADIAPYWPKGIELIHGEYRAITPPFAPVPTPTFDINVTWTRAEYMAHLGSWSAIRYYRERLGKDPLPGFETRLSAAWPADQPKPVHWPVHLRVFRC